MAAIVRRVDDVDYAGGTETEAAVTVPLQLGTEACELDLTEAHYAELRELLAPWFKVAHAAGLKPPRSAGSRKPGRAYNTAMRKWADARGIRYRNADGKVQYPVTLKRDYAAYLESGGTVTPAG